MDRLEFRSAAETIYVNSPQLLDRAVQQMAGSPEIALDLEFDKDRFSYGSTICLIQVFDGSGCWIIDALAGLNLKSLFLVFEDPAVLKIMHSPGEDLQLLHLQGCYPKSIFDTERCARLLDFPAFSLSSLMEQFTGAPLDKSQQKTDWTKRPLNDAQLKYAAKDVIYLPELRTSLLQLAKEKGIESWVNEENAAWEKYRAEEKPEGQFTNKDDSKRLPPFYLYVYNALLGLRDEHARRMNKPGYQVLTKEVLTDLVFSNELLNDWQLLKGIHYSLKSATVQRQVKNCLETAVKEATEKQLAKRKPTSGLNPMERQQLAKERNRLDALIDIKLRPALQEIASVYGTNAAAYILNEKTMTEIVSGRLKISDLSYNYRNVLIMEIAAAKGIDLTEFV